MQWMATAMAASTSGTRYSGTPTAGPERADHRTIGCGLAFACDDLHLDTAPPADERCSDFEKIRIQILPSEAKVLGHRLPVEGDAEGAGAHSPGEDGGRNCGSTTLADRSRERPRHVRRCVCVCRGHGPKHLVPCRPGIEVIGDRGRHCAFEGRRR